MVETGWFSETFNDTELKTNPSKISLDRNPVYKDTVIIPKNGYVRIRFRTQTAGFLFFHCHYDFHLQVGMAGVLQVGELKSMPKPPKNFPQCRDYTP